MLICYMITCHHALTLSLSFVFFVVVFVRFEYSNSYMWLEFHNAPLDKDIALITDVSELPLNLNLSISLYTQYLQRRLKYLAGNPFVAYPWTTWWIQLHEYASMSLYHKVKSINLFTFFLLSISLKLLSLLSIMDLVIASACG